MTEHKSGPEFDALIAEKVMGWHRKFSFASSNGQYWFTKKPSGADCNPNFRCPRFSIDIAAAWEVVEKMFEMKRLSYFRLQWNNGKGVWESSTGGGWVEAPAAPMAICLATIGSRRSEGEVMGFNADLIIERLNRVICKHETENEGLQAEIKRLREELIKITELPGHCGGGCGDGCCGCIQEAIQIAAEAAKEKK